MSERRVLLASNYNAWPEVFNGQSYAFLNVIANVETADRLAPEPLTYREGYAVRPTFEFLFGELITRSYSQLRRAVGRTRFAAMQRESVQEDYDLFFYMCQAPMDLCSLDRIDGWRDRSQIAAVYILESWSQHLSSAKAELRLLDKFDHVFVLNSSSIPHIQRYTKTPCSFLPSASDCLLATPYPDMSERNIDVFSMGRRSPKLHAKLLDLSREDKNFFYVYDTSKHGRITSWHDHRSLSCALMRRSKFFVAFDLSVSDLNETAKNKREDSLSTRYFEGAASGAVMIGSPQTCADFKKAFDWEDAVIEIPADPKDLRAVLDELQSNPDRLARASFMNATQSLRRHDWSHRWQNILWKLGLEETDKLKARISQLNAIASSAERSQNFLFDFSHR